MVTASSELTLGLAELTAALDRASPDQDLSHSLHTLTDDASRAVRSFLGLSITVTVDGQDVTLTSTSEMLEPADIHSTLRVPLAVIDPQLVGTVVFYAGRPDALVGLADELRAHVPATARHEVRLHAAAEPPSSVEIVSGITGAQDLAAVNRAIGLLIGRGHLPDDAQAELETLAVTAGVPVAVVARQLLDQRRGRSEVQ